MNQTHIGGIALLACLIVAVAIALVQAPKDPGLRPRTRAARPWSSAMG